MSLQRKRVTVSDDPLGLFGGGSSNAKKTEEEEQPSLPQVVKKVPVIPPTENKPKPQKSIESNVIPPVPQVVAKKEVVTPPVQDKTPANPPVLPEPVQETIVSPPKAPEEVTPKQVAAKVSPEKPAPAPVVEAIPKVQEDIFLVNESTPVSAPTTLPTSPKKEDIPKKQTIIRSDEDISDLAVASILEREENLDYDMFGKVDMSAKPRAMRTKQTLEEDLSFLEELDKITRLDGNKAETESTVKQSAVSNNGGSESSGSSKALVDVDINNFNLDDYISQQMEDSDGGLFD
jgi:hypothetical protein